MAAFASSTVSKSAFTGRSVAIKARAPQAARPAAFVVRAAKVGNWLPGSDTPSYLDNLPGSYGFDPLGLGSSSGSLERFTESEIIHGRWAMLGVAGSLAGEILGQGNWADAPLWAVNGGTPTYLGIPVPFNLTTLLAIEFVAMAGAEVQRGATQEAEKRKYPGGAFDPFGFSKGNLEELKLKEIKNGRLAMVSFIGFIGQHAANGKSPLAALQSHLADPWANNFATNGVSIPF
jgi:light-harvesting complex I chlorophyll a/b binding protein 1